MDRIRCWFMPMRPVTPFMMMPSLRVAIGWMLLSVESNAASAERRHRVPVGLRRARITHAVETGDRQPPIADAQPHRAVRAFVEVRMRGEKCMLLGFEQRGHAVDVVVAV